MDGATKMVIDFSSPLEKIKHLKIWNFVPGIDIAYYFRIITIIIVIIIIIIICIIHLSNKLMNSLVKSRIYEK